MKLTKMYLSDSILNIAGQAVLLAGGCAALFFGTTAMICWAALVLGYGAMLARFARGCVRRGGSFPIYCLCVMLPANAIAAAVGCCYIVLGRSAAHLVGNIAIGAVLLAGTLAVSLCAEICYRVILCGKSQS